LSARPLDTLLATWGQVSSCNRARDIFGAIGVEVRAPEWLGGGVALGAVLLPTTRLFIILVALLVLGGLGLILRYTRIGLLVRAVNQDRMMASACGIDVGRVDLAVFCLGSGIAGLAGVMLALLGPVTPNVGQSYIIPAFLVVVMGGLARLSAHAWPRWCWGFSSRWRRFLSMCRWRRCCC
jgi:urea transport system permease protein